MAEPISTAYGIIQGASALWSVFSNLNAAKRQRAIGKAAYWDAIERGEESIFAFRGDSKRLLGRQRAIMAARGVDVTQGDARDIAQETRDFIERDVKTLRRNAMREARALRSGANSQANQFTSQAFAAGVQGVGTLMYNAPDAWQLMMGGRNRVGAGQMVSPAAQVPRARSGFAIPTASV